MLERLNPALSPRCPDGIEAPRSLLLRVEQALDENVILPVPDPVVKPAPDKAAEEAMAEMVKAWAVRDFMALMLMGDEEQLGTKPDTD